MKQLLVLSAAVFFLGSCEKCSECHYELNEKQVEIGEYCKEDLENIENTGYYDAVTDSTYEVHCHEH
jgi:hypothetical protein